MLDNLYFVEDIKHRYHLKSDGAARRIMHLMGATGRPLHVTEEAIRNWDRAPSRKYQCEERIQKRP